MDNIVGIYNYGLSYPYYSRKTYSLLVMFLKEVGDPSHDRYFDIESFYKTIMIYGNSKQIKTLIDSDNPDSYKMEEIMKLGVEARRAERIFIDKRQNMINLLI